MKSRAGAGPRRSAHYRGAAVQGGRDARVCSDDDVLRVTSGTAVVRGSAATVRLGVGGTVLVAVSSPGRGVTVAPRRRSVGMGAGVVVAGTGVAVAGAGVVVAGGGGARGTVGVRGADGADR